MKEVTLFRDAGGSWVTNLQLLGLLERVQAFDAAILYIHSGIAFGSPNTSLSRRDILAHLYEVVCSLRVPSILVPTFTFSFCNNQSYCVQTSPSRMGAFNEYIRRRPGAVRTVDPLMSTTLMGEDRDLVTSLGTNSVGRSSTFDKLHQRGPKVKFLFLGTTASECFTYTHYVEERLAVPYRYNRTFTGRITDGGVTWEDTYALFVRYKGVVPSSGGLLEQELMRRGLMLRERCGDSSLSCIGEPGAYATIVEQLQADISSYIAADPGDRNTEFSVSNMVAL